MQGKITKFFPDRHYGFIRESGGTDWFFHEDDVVAVPLIERGVLVSFEQGTNRAHPEKTKAVNIRKLTAVDVLTGAQ